VSTKIDRSTQDRPHFFIVYGTKNRAGLIAFRNTEYTALREHAKNRSAAKSRKREAREGIKDLWANFEAEQQGASIDDLVAEQKLLAKEHLLVLLSQRGWLQFASVVDSLLQAFMLRETNIKDVCVELAREGKLQNTWGLGNRKPGDETIISIVRSS
jgi:hypothetical protein